MINNAETREPIQEIFAGGVFGAVLGGAVTFGLAFIFADSIMLATVMAMQGAFTGEMGLAWAVAMQLSHGVGDPASEVGKVLTASTQAVSKQTPALRRVA